MFDGKCKKTEFNNVNFLYAKSPLFDLVVPAYTRFVAQRLPQNECKQTTFAFPSYLKLGKQV